MDQREDITVDKLRGGYYTPIAVADFIIKWGMEINPSHILEPSCGDGVFIEALFRHSKVNPSNFFECDLQSVELIKEERNKSNEILIELVKSSKATGECHNSEFFQFTQQKYHSKSPFVFPDLIIGNPPYIRYQYFEYGRGFAEKRLSELGIKTTKHANSWVHFLAESVSLLNKSKTSRIGFIIPTELMHVTYARPLRRWLEENFSQIRILTFRDLMFKGIQQEVVLFLGERDPQIVDLKSFKKANLRVLQYDDISQVPENFWSFYNNKAPKANQFQDKWTGYFLEKKELELYQKLKAKNPRFSDFMSIDIGIVTGANKFFCVNKSELEALKIQVGHSYDGVSLEQLMGRSTEVQGLKFSSKDHQSNFEAGKNCIFLRFEKDFQFSQLEPIWQKKIKHGIKLGLPNRYKCRIREPWYWIPSVYSSEISMFKRASGYTRLIVNECDAFTTDTVYRINILQEHKKNFQPHQMAFSFFNSLSFLSCELEGRFYGGGVLELVPSEVENTILPISKISKKDSNKLDLLLRKNTDIEEILDYTDSVLLSHISKKDRLMVRSAWIKLRNRRLQRAKSKGLKGD